MAKKAETFDGRTGRPFATRVSDRERNAYKRTAKAAGLTPGTWARLVLNAAAGIDVLSESIERVAEAK